MVVTLDFVSSIRTRCAAYEVQQLPALHIGAALLGFLDDRAERWVRENHVERSSLQLRTLVSQPVETLQGVEANDVGMAIVVQDHVHLSDARNLVVDFDSEQAPFRKLVPRAKRLVRIFRVI